MYLFVNGFSPNLYGFTNIIKSSICFLDTVHVHEALFVAYKELYIASLHSQITELQDSNPISRCVVHRLGLVLDLVALALGLCFGILKRTILDESAVEDLASERIGWFSVWILTHFGLGLGRDNAGLDYSPVRYCNT